MEKINCVRLENIVYLRIYNIYKIIYIKEDLKPFWRVFEKTTGPISHFLVSFEPYCPSSGYRLSKMSNFWSCIDLGHILKNRVLAPITPNVKTSKEIYFFQIPQNRSTFSK